MKSLVRMKFGSQLYGTATPSSDTDIKAVHVPDANAILLGRYKNVIAHTTGDNFNKNSAEDVDFESFTLSHFLKLLMDGQTVALDMIFAPADMLEETSPEWEFLVKNRQKFLSKQCESFLGYCKQQANKYGIKGSRVAAARTICEYLRDQNPKDRIGEVINETFDIVTQNEFIEVIEITQANGTVLKHLEVCNRKIPFTSTVKEGLAIYERVFKEYGQRALLAETNEGVDWKALSHAVRIGRQATDLLNGKDIIFPLPYADHLLKIKTGAYSYPEVANEIEHLLEVVEQAAANSALPQRPDEEFSNAFIRQVYRNEVKLNDNGKDLEVLGNEFGK